MTEVKKITFSEEYESLSEEQEKSSLASYGELEIKDHVEYLENSKIIFLENFNRRNEALYNTYDFKFLRTLGTGAFGRVVLALNMKTKTYHAIKVIRKEKIIRMNQLGHVLNERRILQAMDFPFIVHLDFCFKDNSNVYIAMPFIKGGEMFTHLRKVGRFGESQAKFYAGQVVLALEYLHYLDLAYRDLKPENILLDTTGYVKIVDLGFCKMIKSRTWTLCGTPEYIAPEVILNKGYGKSVDWWGFGVLIYEMVAGHAPFYAKDPIRIYEKIVRNSYVIPRFFSADLKDLVSNVLQVDLSRRYGNLKNGVNDIKNHLWFESIDWLLLLNKKITPSYIPSIDTEGDHTSYQETPIKIGVVDTYVREFQSF